MPSLIFYTKPNCPLCDEAKNVVKKFENEVVFQEVDISAPGNEYLFGLYRYEIPVIRIDAITIHNKFITEDAVKKALNKEK